MGSRDRRKYPRFEGTFPVDLLNMGDDPAISQFVPVISGSALDVSKQGMRLKALYNVSVGSLLSVVIYYKKRESVCLSEVIWKRNERGESTYGLFFREWSKLDKNLDEKLSSMEQRDPSEENSSKTTCAIIPSPGTA